MDNRLRRLLLIGWIMALVPNAAVAQTPDEDPRWLHIGVRAMLLPVGRAIETDESDRVESHVLPFDFAPSAYFDATVLRPLSLGVGADIAARSTIVNVYARFKLHHPVGPVEPYVLLAPGYSQIIHGGRDARGFNLAMAVGLAYSRGWVRPFFELGYMWGFQQRELGSDTSPPIYTQDNCVDRVLIVIGLQFSFGGGQAEKRPLPPSERRELEQRQEQLRRQLPPERTAPPRDEPPPSSQPSSQPAT